MRLIEENHYGVVEGFVYEYKNQRWYKYRKGVGYLEDLPSFSDLLELDLNDFL